jgi:hypothetical protein
MKKRLAAFLTVIGMGALALAPTAGATPPTHDTFNITGPDTLTGICSFPIHLEGNIDVRESVYTDRNGDLTRIVDHVREQDVFSAHGVSIQTFPYHYSVHVLFDDTGNATHAWATGTVVRMRLPDGTLFNSAGRADVFNTNGSFTIVPEMGHSGDLAAFCEALS